MSASFNEQILEKEKAFRENRPALWIASMLSPFLLIGFRTSWRRAGGQIAISGVIGVLLCTIATMRASTIHETTSYRYCCSVPH